MAMRPYILSSLLGFTGYPCLRLGENALVLVGVLQEVGNIKEGIALQPDVHKRRLHAWQDATDAALVDATHQSDIDVTLVRVVWLIMAFMTVIGFLSYPIAWIVMPEEPLSLPAPLGAEPVQNP